MIEPFACGVLHKQDNGRPLNSMTRHNPDKVSSDPPPRGNASDAGLIIAKSTILRKRFFKKEFLDTHPFSFAGFHHVQRPFSSEWHLGLPPFILSGQGFMK
jgi:hypothetical protein